MIKAIGFDWGGVMVGSKPYMQGLAEIFGIDKDELRTFYLQYNHLAGVGDMSYPDVWRLIAKKLGQSEKADMAVSHLEQQMSKIVVPEMMKLVDELRTKGYKVGLLSNNTKQAGISMRSEGHHTHFDSFLISAEIGFQKPHIEAFQLLFDSLNTKPEETVFIDDSVSSLAKADIIGYHPILFTGYENLRKDLEKLNIL